MELTSMEKRRRAWAAEQDPPLVTVQQVAEMLGHQRGTYVRRIMAHYEVPHLIPESRQADFPEGDGYYPLLEARAAVGKYLVDRPRMPGTRIASPKPASALTRLGGVTVPLSAPHGWTLDQLKICWKDSPDMRGVVEQIYERCPSFTQLTFEEAKALVVDLVQPDMAPQLMHPPYERSDFMQAARELTRGRPDELAQLTRVLEGKFHLRNFCRINPGPAVAVVLELLRSK